MDSSEKLIILNRNHIDEFVPPHLVERLNDTLVKINHYLPITDDYIIINKKESYAYLIEDIISQYKQERK